MGSPAMNWPVCFLLFSSCFFFSVLAPYGDYPTANVATTWTANSQEIFADGSVTKPIVVNNLYSLAQFPVTKLAFAFYANQTDLSNGFFYLVIYTTLTTSDSSFAMATHPQKLLWWANRDKPVKENATLDFTSNGDLVLTDVDGTLVWSTNTSGKSVVSMKITETGNLLLFDSNNVTVWQSFDHPTDPQLPIYGDYPTAKISTKWTTNSQFAIKYSDGTIFIPVVGNTLKTLIEYPAIGFGFYATGTQASFFLVVVWITDFVDSPIVLWSANRDKPVTKNAVLLFTYGGDLQLRDVDDAIVWSTNTTCKSVGMTIAKTGDLFLFDTDNTTVWHSFDSPTDTWLPGQKLGLEQKLISNSNPSNWTPGPYYLSLSAEKGLCAFIESDPPQMYHTVFPATNRSRSFKTGSLNILDNSVSVNYSAHTKQDEAEQDFQFMRLESDGHLRVYQETTPGVRPIDDILTGSLGNCSYPTACGTYGICSNRNCSCPKGADAGFNYFEPLDSSQPRLGCRETTQLSCENLRPQTLLLELRDVSYFDFSSVRENIDIASCKQACLNTCSCKAVLFRSRGNASFGKCSLPSQLFSLMTGMNEVVGYNSTTFVKVQKSSVPNTNTTSGGQSQIPPKKRRQRAIILGSIAGIVPVLFLAIGLGFLVARKRKGRKEAKENESYDDGESYLDLASGMPRRFSFDDLKLATEDFHKRLGGGGFGSVFEGTLSDGMKVAVKRLDQLGQGRKEFFAEVKTIGCVQHINLVTLVGYCTENAQRLLVYEYMCNGSLDRWIFHKNEVSNNTLDWQTRSKIILDIAKGLSYIHEDCRKRIAHLDIKPQNILLDSNFNAKVSDFGLARMIDRDQTQVITTLRGTRGYLAPEWWLNRRITEKVDVYSFGVVVLEMMCGRKNLDYSEFEENECLLHLVKSKAEEGQLFDLVTKYGDDLEEYREAAVKMMMIAIWCLQGDYVKRPPMSMVVKVLEGTMEMELISDYSFLTLTPELPPEKVDTPASALLSDMILSGPR